MSRRTERIDYQKLATTGERVVIESSTVDDSINSSASSCSSDEGEMAAEAEMKSLLIEEACLSDEIEDFIDEHDVRETQRIDELKDISDKIDILRSKFRRIHKELETLLKAAYEDHHGKTFTTKMASIKIYIRAIKDVKMNAKAEEAVTKNSEDMKQYQMMKFQGEEVERLASEMEVIFKFKLGEASDAEIKRRQENLKFQINLASELSHNMQDLMKGEINLRDEIKINALNARYNDVIVMKNAYTKELEHEVLKRDLDKKNTFEVSKLNIKLMKFKGYDSAEDIYTFRSNFEKLHLCNTPQHLMCDLLKNNYLEYPALSLVKSLEDISIIWERLTFAYGDCKIMLEKKLSTLSKMDGIWKFRDPGKQADKLASVVSIMQDLLALAKKHDIMNNLFYGDATERIYKLLGEQRITRWFSLKCDKKWTEEYSWSQLIDFLEKEIKINQQKSLLGYNVNHDKQRNSKEHGGAFFTRRDSPGEPASNNLCYICGEESHVATNGPGSSKIVQYFACKVFVEMSPAERFKELRRNGLCYQCLFPGAKQNLGKHKDGRCQHDFKCNHEKHNRYKTKMHVLVCEEHKCDENNKKLLEKYKERFILQHPVPAYSKDIRLSFHTSSREASENNDDKAIYMLQSIQVDGKKYTVFYDTGCNDFLSKNNAIKMLGRRASKELDGPVRLGGVGGVVTESRFGVYAVSLPLRNGKDALMTGICLEQITQDFPEYPLTGKVEDDIHTAFNNSGGDAKTLPKLHPYVGGQVDFMIGIKYLRYFPELVFQLPSGLTIYRSQFKNVNGSFGVIGGPHQIFTAIESYHCLSKRSNFVMNQLQLHQNGFHVNPDASRLTVKSNEERCDICCKGDVGNSINNQVMLSRQLAIFNEVELAGSQITYRCVECRDCSKCKSQNEELISIKEEIEQKKINESVKFDVVKGITVAKLPLLHDPKLKLLENKNKALKVFNQQMTKLQKNDKDKEDVINSEKKLHDLGHVDFLKNLPTDVQQILKSNDSIHYYIPWRAVWKDSSISTPCRMVFDASQPTSSGYSLNDILAKGRNNMNKLVEIFIRWRSHKVAFHTDVAKMYNAVKLNQDDWCFQRYLWKEGLDDSKPLEEKIIKTLIYGVRSSGNQAETGLRMVAEYSKDEYPKVNQIIQKDVYVDDCMSGESTKEKAMERADQIDLVLNRGGFKLKGITMSGSDPHDKLSSDGKTVSVAGLLWYSKDDQISIDVKELNFAKKHRGRKTKVISTIPERLTRRQCTSKVAEIFDLTGMLTPIVASMKLDLHNLVTRKLDWDDRVPDTMRGVWNDHFEMMAEIKSLKFNRAVIPVDAVNMDAQTLCFGDASKLLACIAIYARFKRTCGEFSCQLVFGRSRLIPDGMSQPRAELYAAVVNSHSAEVVRKSFYQHKLCSIMFTDSQIVLHWISNENRTLKQWVRNRIIEIQRFTTVTNWRYVHSKDMIADLGTRPGCSIKEVDSSSHWVNGFEWMKLPDNKFPSYTLSDIKLSQSDWDAAKKEASYDVIQSTFIKRYVPDEVRKRYDYSKYILDPNKHRFKTTLRILAYVMKFVKNIKDAVKNKDKPTCKQNNMQKNFITEDDIKCAENYYFMKATAEIKKFRDVKEYQKLSTEKNGILSYTGRILPSDTITVVGKMTNAMKDLQAVTFCVPLIDKFSPVAYSLVDEIHWYDKTVMHGGIECVWRQILKSAYIIEGRELLKNIKSSCHRCRYLQKQRIKVAMAPVSSCSLTVAPAFYYTQVDICGPFDAFSQHHKRTTVKIWLIVFCCIATSATSIKVMEDYSSTSFILAFTRFSCTYGYPKKLFSDEGSQLIKAFNSMKTSFVNMKHQLFQDAMIDFQLCPVGGHNMNGKVERKIQHIKTSLEKTLHKDRLSIIQWESIVSTIANEINNLPLALGNLVSNFDTMDLITPNRLLLGRNNERSPVGNMTIVSNSAKIFKSNSNIFNAWFENWLINHVPKLMEQPKWFKSDESISIGDIVLFLKLDNLLCSTYQYGIVESTQISKDGRIRKVEVKYKNSTENVFRTTFRAVRELMVIHYEDEVGIYHELSKKNSN